MGDWSWKQVRPPKFRLGQKVWVLYDEQVSRFEITRIDAVFVADAEPIYDYSGYIIGDSYHRFNESVLRGTKKEAAEALHIKQHKLKLERLRSEKHELLIELDMFKRYSSGALEKRIKELEADVSKKCNELAQLEGEPF